MSGYWEDREATAQTKLTNRSVKATEKQLQKYFNKTLEKTLDNFEKVYLKIFHSIQEGKEVTPADLYKLDKYWELQGQLKKELEKLGDKQVDLLTQRFTEHYEMIYKSLAIKGEPFFNTLNEAGARQMINSIWCADGKSWSERVWTNTNKLQEALNDNLIHCVITGAKPAELRKKLMEQFNVAYYRADSVVRTEMAHIQTQAAKQRYADYGIEEVQVWADKDERRCDVCGKLHKMRYPIHASIPIPAHPNCRCCIIPVVEV